MQKIQITKIRNERGEIATLSTDMRRIIKEHTNNSENELDSLETIDLFLEMMPSTKMHSRRNG